MLLALPLGIADAPARPRPMTWAIALLALVTLVVEQSLPLLPEAIYVGATLIGGWPLQSDPASGLFASWQLWSYALIADGWLQLLLLLPLWWIVAGYIESRLGPPLFLLLVLVLTPLGVAVPVLAGEASPRLSLLPLLVALSGFAIALPGQRRIHWRLWAWLVSHLLRYRFTTPLGITVAVYLCIELTRMLVVSWSGPRGLVEPGADFYPFFAANLVIVLVVGHACGSFFHAAAEREAAIAPTPLSRLAAGSGELGELEGILGSAPELPLEQLERVAERCLIEGDRRTASLLAGYLALRAPASDSYRALRRWLDGE